MYVQDGLQPLDGALRAKIGHRAEEAFQVVTLQLFVEAERELLVHALQRAFASLALLHQPYLVAPQQVLVHQGALVGGEDELRGDGVGVFEKQLHQLAHQAGVEAAFHLVDEKHLLALNQVEYQGDVVENALGAVAFVNQREVFGLAVVDAAVYGGEFLGLYLPLGVGN